ncbi:MAG: hypothetical protein JST65_01225 [Acidobacteria bacterium]|nr:hypothetical protein [Acidobacteriota bacterium]
MSTISETIRPFIVAMATACAGISSAVSASDFSCEYALLDETKPDGAETVAIAFDKNGVELYQWPLTLPYAHGGYSYAGCEKPVSFSDVQDFTVFRYIALLPDGGQVTIKECQRPKDEKNIPQYFHRMCKAEEVQLAQISNLNKGGAGIYSITTASTRCRKVSIGGGYFVTSACVR